MRSPKLSTAGLSLATAATALALAACNDVPSGPGQTRGLLSAIRPSSDQPAFRNSIKYSDAGLKPATGRAGSATVTARALAAADGGVDLEVTTGALDGGTSRGNIDKVQIKGLNPKALNTAIWTLNYAKLRNNGYAKYHIGGLARGRKLQVQANVSGIDFNRTGVVTVTEMVKLRPDLVVSSIDAPESALPGASVQIGATVGELNGDVGARADCVLYVDGAEADRARRIWVDAGGTVSCAFEHAFAQEGTHQLTVALERPAPADWDASNNQLSRSITIAAPAPAPAPPPPPGGAPESHPQAFTFSAHAEDANLIDRSSSTSDFSWTSSDGSSGQSQSEYSSGREGHWQSSLHSGNMPKQLAFPIARIEAAQSSGGASLASIVATNVDVEWTNKIDYGAGSVSLESCAKRHVLSDVAGILDLTVCSGRWTKPDGDEEWTTFEQRRWAGTVTYRSYTYEYNRSVAPDGTPTEDTYVFNDPSTESAGTTPTLGSSYTMSVLFTLADGTTYGSSAEVPLAAFGDAWSDPYQCQDGGYEIITDGYWFKQTGQSCYEAEYSFSGVMGDLYGEPALTP